MLGLCDGLMECVVRFEVVNDGFGYGSVCNWELGTDLCTGVLCYERVLCVVVELSSTIWVWSWFLWFMIGNCFRV